MAAVGGGVHRHVVRPPLHAALQNGLKNGVAGIPLLKGEVVDENDELVPPSPEGADESGQTAEVFLVRFDDAQVLRAGEGEQVLHRGRFARSALAVEEDVVHAPS